MAGAHEQNWLLKNFVRDLVPIGFAEQRGPGSSAGKFRKVGAMSRHFVTDCRVAAAVAAATRELAVAVSPHCPAGLSARRRATKAMRYILVWGY